MFKRIARLTAALSVVAILGAGLAGAAFAQGPAQPAQPGANFGAGRGAFGPAWGGQSTLGTVSTLTGLSTDEIRDQRQDGKSLAQVAASKGVSEIKLVEAILAAKRTVLAEMVKESKLTQVQADAMLAQMKDKVAASVDRTTTGPANGRGNGVCVATGTAASGQALGQGAGATGGFGRGMGRFQAPAATR